METKVLEIKAVIAAVFSTIGVLLGWQGVLMLVWLGCMILDYASGYIGAKVTDTWKSEKAREGVAHKAGMIFVVCGSVAADVVFSMAFKWLPVIKYDWPVAFMPIVLIWYILTEIGSIMENAAEMGAPIPSWLTTGIKKSIDVINKTAVDDKQNE